MKKEIETRNDVTLLVDSFYHKVQNDTLLEPIFNDMAKINWEIHLPKMYDFWENILFNTGSYKGNTLKMHLNLNSQYKLLTLHFERWLKLFKQTVNELFIGNNAQLAINKADSIATVIRIKISKQSTS